MDSKAITFVDSSLWFIKVSFAAMLLLAATAKPTHNGFHFQQIRSIPMKIELVKRLPDPQSYRRSPATVKASLARLTFA